MNRTPFQPWCIQLNDGSVITINEPFELATQRNSPSLIVYSGDRMQVVSYRNVTKIATPSAAD